MSSIKNLDIRIFIHLRLRHNFRGFDSHLILHTLDLILDKARFSSLSRNSEQIITMSIGMFRFVDTMSFMPSSLEKLVDLLKHKNIDKFVHTQRLGGVNAELLYGKGIYPYEYLDSIDKLRETQLPKKEDFNSLLTGKTISEDDYRRAQHIWTIFKCRTLSDYTRLYCRSDTHLLADVWLNFTSAPFAYFGIHAEAGYVTLPSYAFDCFKQTIHRLNGTLMRVMDETMQPMYEDILKGIRGGSCMLRQKVSFDSTITNSLLQIANERETSEYDEYLLTLARKAKEESQRGKKARKLRICSYEGCTELARVKISTCIRHAEKTLLAFDFNNLSELRNAKSFTPRLFTPTSQFFYTDISAISGTFRNSATCTVGQ